MDFLNANFNKWFESHLSFLKKTYHGKKKARYFQKLSSFKVLTTRKKMGKNSHVNFQVWTSLELPRQQKWSTNWKNINFLVFLVLTMTMKKGQRTEGTYTNYSVDSIKHTVLLKVLLQIFLLASIKSTVHWKFSRQMNFAYCLY